jgi:hypothetical protein
MPSTATARPFPIIPLDDEREPTITELLAVSHEHNQALLRDNTLLQRRIDALEQDNRSLRSRTRTMEAALLAIRPRAEEFQAEPVLVGVYGQGAIVEQIVVGAQTCEALGDVPIVRFLRTTGGAIAGVELAYLPGVIEDDDGAFDPTYRVLALLASSGARAS